MATDDKQDREHLLGMVETLQAENAALAAWAKAAEDEAARVVARRAKVENQLDRFRAEAFWDCVMQEIAEHVAERGPLTPDKNPAWAPHLEFQARLLSQGAAAPRTLRKKMDVRVTHLRYFEAPVEGRYAQRNA